MVTRLLLSLLISLLAISRGFSLPSSDGGYDIVFTIDGGEGGDDFRLNPEEYKENVQVMMTTFSNELWKSSRGRFYIKSATLIVPDNEKWESVVADSTASHLAAKSDVKLSTRFISPSVDNPHICGKAGNHINMPLSFFFATGADEFGTPWKTFVNQWARYRFGVWPEYGMPNTRFSYFYKNTNSFRWEVTGCSNVPIVGEYKNVTDTDIVCDITPREKPDEICRLYPSRNGNTAATSLMNLHYLDSVQEFCDDTNHNAMAPNMHNANCDRKSVWGVIQETEDFNAVTSPINLPLPTVNFKVVKPSQKPHVHFLFDNGETNLQDGWIPIVVNHILPIFLGNPLYDDVYASISYFKASSVDTKVHLAQIGENTNDFIDGLAEFDVGGSFRDFGKALLDVARQIKQNAHPAIIFVLKTGYDKDRMGDLSYEEEVIQLLKGERVAILATEFMQENQSVGHLLRSTIETGNGGRFYGIWTKEDLVGTLPGVMTSLDGLIGQEWIQGETTSFIHRETLLGGTNFEIKKAAYHGDLTFSVTTAQTVTGFQIGENSVIPPADGEWGEGRFVYKTTFTEELTENRNFSFICAEPVCSGYLIVTGPISEDVQMPNFIVKVYSNAVGGVADFSNPEDQTEYPLTLHAEVTSETGSLISNLAVKAIARDASGNEDIIELLDNGFGFPDKMVDGIFSAYYMPHVSGDGQVTVTFEISVVPQTPVPGIRIIPTNPEDQFKPPESVGDEFFSNAELDSAISVVAFVAEEYVGRVYRVEDLIEKERQEGAETFDLEFTAPIVLRSPPSNDANDYTITIYRTIDVSIPDQEEVGTRAVNSLSGQPIVLEGLELSYRSFYYIIKVSAGDVDKSSPFSLPWLVSVDEEGSPPTVPPQPTTDIPDITNPSTDIPDPNPTPDTPEPTLDPSEPSESPTTPTPTTPSTTTPTPSSTTTTPTPTITTPAPRPTTTTKKPFFESTGGIITIVAIVLVVFAVAAAAFFYRRKIMQKKLNETA